MGDERVCFRDKINENQELWASIEVSIFIINPANISAGSDTPDSDWELILLRVCCKPESPNELQEDEMLGNINPFFRKIVKVWPIDHISQILKDLESGRVVISDYQLNMRIQNFTEERKDRGYLTLGGKMDWPYFYRYGFGKDIREIMDEHTINRVLKNHGYRNLSEELEELFGVKIRSGIFVEFIAPIFTKFEATIFQNDNLLIELIAHQSINMDDIKLMSPIRRGTEIGFQRLKEQGDYIIYSSTIEKIKSEKKVEEVRLLYKGQCIEVQEVQIKAEDFGVLKHSSVDTDNAEEIVKREIYIPLTDNSGNKIKSQYFTTLANDLVKYFGGYTVSLGEGGWRSPEDGIDTETHQRVVIDINEREYNENSTKIDPFFKYFCEKVALELGQEALYSRFQEKGSLKRYYYQGTRKEKALSNIIDNKPFGFETSAEFDKETMRIRLILRFANESGRDILVSGYYFQLGLGDSTISSTNPLGIEHNLNHIVHSDGRGNVREFGWVGLSEYNIANPGTYTIRCTITYIMDGKQLTAISFCEIEIDTE